MKKFFCVFLLVFTAIFSLFAQETEITTITINNARQTSYKKADDSGNDTIVLEGSVELEVKKSATSSKIKADRITYDRTTEMLYAEGNVEIVTSSSAGEDTTTATSLLLNTSTLEGIFDGGRVVQTQSDSLNLPSGSTLIVFSEMFGKSSSNTIAFKNSSLTFCEEEDPHWQIKSTRTWLLPGGEFAFFNALLYVGNIPVLYLPAFYYPKDELIFNPVFSYSKREGYSIQTTTYLWGRKPLDTSSSTSSSSSSSSSSSDTSTTSEALAGIYNFVKPTTLKEQVREGLVLHNLDEDFTGSTSEYVKVMADWYSNLGFMFGLDSKFAPSKTYLTSLAFSFDIGLSNTLFPNSSYVYYPFSSSGNTYRDEASFLGFTTPFRYSANLELSLSKPFSLKLSLPIYSDPFYNYDFKTNRSETMDWISYLIKNSGGTQSTEAVTISEVSSFTWQLSASASPVLPAVLKPYITSLSVNLNSYINISSQNADTSYMTYRGTSPSDGWKNYSPSRKFYYPSLINPATANVSFSGTLFSWPAVDSNQKQAESISYPIALNVPDELKTEKQLEEEAAAAEKSSEEDKKNGAKEEKTESAEDFKFYLPDLEYTPSTQSITEGLTYKLSYTASANLVTQMAYSSANLKKSDDFDWTNIRSSMYTLKTPVSLTSTMNYGGDFFSVVNGLSYSPVYQKHPYASSDSTTGYTQTQLNNLVLADYKTEKQDLLNTNTITLKPFLYTGIFKDSSISWNSTIKLYRREFIGDVDNPQWDNLGLDWSNKECITVNSLTALISAKELSDKISQSLTLTAIMPPLTSQYTAALSLSFPYVTASLSTGIQKVEATSESAQTWTKNPLAQAVTVSIPIFNKTLSFSESYNYNLEDNYSDSLKFAASWNGLSLAYVMSYTYGYNFSKASGWTSRDSKEFLPYSLTFSYSSPSKTFYRWFNRISISPGLSTSLVADLIRPTNSYLLFTPSLTLKVTDFMSLTFSSTSRNSVLYWYFHNETGDLYSEWGGFPGNVVKDLIDSFRFDKQSLREASGFKLKSLNMTLTHDLHDWMFNFTLKIEPRVVVENGTKVYDFSPYVTIGVTWNPMESFKTSIVDKYGEWYVE